MMPPTTDGELFAAPSSAEGVMDRWMRTGLRIAGLNLSPTDAFELSAEIALVELKLDRLEHWQREREAFAARAAPFKTSPPRSPALTAATPPTVAAAPAWRRRTRA